MKTINMKKIIVAVALLVLIGENSYSQSQQKLAQSSFQFLSVVSDARAAAMGEALNSNETGSSSLFMNPAGMATMDGLVDVTGSSNKWIADIKHYTMSIALKPFGGDYGVLGFSLQYVDYGNFIGTVVDKTTDLGYRETGLFKLNSRAIGMGYAKQLTDQFSVGGQIRMAWQDLGESIIPNLAPVPVKDSTGTIISYTDTTRLASNKLNPFVFDFGTQFRTGIKSLVFGMSVRNFSQDMQYVYESFQLPLTFTLGISMNVLDLADMDPKEQSLLVCVDASHYRDHAEQIKVGMEYKFFEVVALRGGYISNNDESSFSYGIGLSRYGFTIDYSYTPFGIFDNVQRFTTRFSF